GRVPHLPVRHRRDRARRRDRQREIGGRRGQQHVAVRVRTRGVGWPEHHDQPSPVHRASARSEVARRVDGGRVADKRGTGERRELAARLRPEERSAHHDPTQRGGINNNLVEKSDLPTGSMNNASYNKSAWREVGDLGANVVARAGWLSPRAKTEKRK